MEELDFRPFVSGFSFYQEDNDLIFFNHEKYYRIKGKSSKDLFKVVPLLSGFNTNEEIANKTNLPEDYVVNLVNSLVSKNIVKINSIRNRKILDEDLKRYEMNYLINHDYKEDFIEDTKGFIGKRVFLSGNVEIINKLINKLGKYFQVSLKDPEESDLILGTDFFENEELFAQLNDISLNNNIPFFRSSLINSNMYIGPIFLGNDSSCYNCFNSRIYSNFTNSFQFNKVKKNLNIHSQEQINLLPGTLDIYINLIYLFIIRFFSNVDKSNLINCEYHYNTNNMDSKFNHVLRVPTCKCITNLGGLQYESNQKG